MKRIFSMYHNICRKTASTEATRREWQSVLINTLLSLGKLCAGVLACSAAMVSDAIHSASDVLSTLMVLVSLHLSQRAEDDDHEYGHERLESIAAILLAFLLAVTGIGVGWEGIQRLQHTESLPIPGALALAAAIVSITVKEWMFRVTKKTAVRLSSPALMADAWHHRSDALSSIGSLVGIAAARLGFPMGDPIASLLIAVMIIKSALDIFTNAARQLTDHACSPELESDIRAVILNEKGVQGIDLLHTRQFGSKVYTDVEISADGSLTLQEAHDIAERVHQVVEQSFPQVKHCMIHVNPCEPSTI